MDKIFKIPLRNKYPKWRYGEPVFIYFGIAGVILVTIQCIILIASIYPTEKALKKHFHDDGTRR